MNIIRDILREELNVKFFPGERLTIDDFSSPIKWLIKECKIPTTYMQFLLP